MVAQLSINSAPKAIISYQYKDDAQPSKVGSNCTIRPGTVIYGDVVCGDYFQTGHNAVIREYSYIGDHVVIGTNSIVDGNVKIGSFVKIESGCYIATHSVIGDKVFIGPNVTMTNDKYPLKMRDNYQPLGPIIEGGVTIGGGVTILPGITIGKGSFVAAGSLVTKDVPPMSFVIGAPAKIQVMPKELQEENMALSWRRFIHTESES